MSFGADPDDLGLIELVGLLFALRRSTDAGNLLVAAAGNQSDVPLVTVPAAFDEVIAVSGTLPDDTPAGWILCPREDNPVWARSNFGPGVELSAPFYARSLHLNGTYKTDCGTSMATPVVSGVAALVWTQNPGWTAAQVRQHLRSTATDTHTPGYDEYTGYGRVDAARALGFL